MELLQKILDLPVIVQGALGSALFWLVLESGQRLVRLAASVQSKLGEQDQTAMQIALASVLDEDDETRRVSFQGMVHGALHYSVKALILLAMGLSLQSLAPVFAVVGTLASIVFFFRALAYVPHFDRWPDRAAMLRTYNQLRQRGE